MASIFVIIRKDFLDMLPGRNSDSIKQCAAALLNFFRNQRPGWLTINIPQFQEILFEQWGKEAIRKALELLADEGLIERRHHRLNGRAWQYRLPCQIRKMEQVADPEEATINPDEEQVALSEESVTSSKATSIYKDPLKDQQQDPIAAVEFDFCEEIAEIEQINCSPKIQINQQVKEVIAKNPENVEKAIALVRQAVKTWNVDDKFNWTGLLVKAIKTGLEPFTPAAATQNELTQPESPLGFKEWCESNPLVKTAWYSQPFGEWVAIYHSSLQRPWYEAMGVQP